VLTINDWMAVATTQYVFKLLHRQPIALFVTFHQQQWHECAQRADLAGGTYQLACSDATLTVMRS
jgi:hypothetical protein